ncbi:hypothetical protein IST4116A_02533 [Burkholderia cenocepacia]|nr:hypothetical protein IST439_02600 [Burkholderia cenocepacia]CAB5119519.1 hypothetical protein IST4129_02556 [Burkholderia cenocepacia]CAB5141864.1 hypothetical protein IST4131_02550 [Burkholderia cenocepacia]CAB5143773.1 hypothetical protein IST4134_02453 [Burkholderia cenocepacia]CAB5144885.1 hypothetical protein IST4113_02452 [Burkholderia cenocepacia]
MSKVTVLLSQGEFARLDAYCEEHGFKKSTLISRLIREYLDVQQYPQQSVLPLDTSVLTVSRQTRDTHEQ